MADPVQPVRTASDQKKSDDLFFNAGAMALTISSCLAVATAIECHATSPNNSIGPWMSSLLYGAVFWLWWALVVEVLWRAGRKWPATFRVSPASGAIHLFVAVGVALAHLGILQLTAYWLGKHGARLARAEFAQINFFHFFRFGTEILLYALIWFACVTINTQLAARRDRLRSVELERQLASAHLRALQMQLEPHFLLNTLNAVTTLVELNRGKEALETLDHLNNILKTVLKRNTASKIPLSQELEIVESYLAIERVRFADRLQIDLNLDPNALDCLVPSFLLQPLVENAIRHGIANCEDSGRIEASAQRIGPHMQLRVSDNGPGLNGRQQPGFGVGLNNTKERLTHFYENNYEFRAFQPESGGFEVSITIPYERAVRCG
jgi:Histidine kinase